MDIKHRLQQSTSTCTGSGTDTGAGASTGDQDADHRLTEDGLVRFRDMIYVSNDNELENLNLRGFM